MTKDKIANIDQICKLCRNELNTYLNKDGYELTKEEYYPESFGSRYWIWTNTEAKHCFRLIWDGKERWFVLEESPYVTSLENVAWADVTIVPFDSTNDKQEYMNEILEMLTIEIK